MSFRTKCLPVPSHPRSGCKRAGKSVQRPVSEQLIVGIEIVLEFAQLWVVTLTERRLTHRFARPVGPDVDDTDRTAVYAFGCGTSSIVVFAHGSHLMASAYYSE